MTDAPVGANPSTARSAAHRIPLAEPLIGGNAARYLAECLETNFVSSVGPFVSRFEEAFAATVGSRFAVACSSGTAALHLAMRVLDVGPGDEVVLPSLTFVASLNPIRYERATPILVDSEPETYNLDPNIVVDELERRARTGRQQPKVIEIVDLLGHPADIGPIIDAAERHGIAVIEDASEALGATYTADHALAGRHVGSIGRIGCFSFNGNKVMTTGGGGMLTTDDEALARRARHLSTQARRPGRVYDHDEIGYNYRLSNIAASLGLAQLEELASLVAGRRRNAAHYDEALATMPGLLPAPRAPWADPSFWLYTPRLEDGIEARPIWTPLHAMKIHAQIPMLGGAVAQRIFETAVSLPSSSSLSTEDRDRVIRRLRATLSP